LKFLPQVERKRKKVEFFVFAFYQKPRNEYGKVFDYSVLFVRFSAVAVDSCICWNGEKNETSCKETSRPRDKRSSVNKKKKNTKQNKRRQQ
jgi:hypothetical protein